MSDFNDIGISRELDWPRIKKLLTIGLFAAALLGLFGVVLEGLACFGVYRLMAAKSPKYAHRYHSGIFGYLMFCA